MLYKYLRDWHLEGNLEFRIAMVCSGIDSPIFALNAIRDAAQNYTFDRTRL